MPRIFHRPNWTELLSVLKLFFRNFILRELSHDTHVMDVLTSRCSSSSPDDFDHASVSDLGWAADDLTRKMQIVEFEPHIFIQSHPGSQNRQSWSHWCAGKKQTPYPSLFYRHISGVNKPMSFHSEIPTNASIVKVMRNRELEIVQ